MRTSDDKTRITRNADPRHPRHALRVLYPGPGGNPVNRTFVDRFVVGRAPECEVSIADNGISRQHCELYHDGAAWWVRDLASSNGTFIDGRQVTEARLGNDVRLEFYADGPVVRLQVDETQITHFAASSQQPAARPAEPRAALFQQTATTTTADDRRHHIRFVAGMSVMTALLLVALVVIAIQYFQHADESDIAAQTFEQIKALELELARVKLELAQQPERPAPTALTNADQRLQAMKQRYAALAEERALLGSHRSKEDLLIFRIARVFGEYDLDIPDSFVAEVKRYIRVWQQSDRLVNAISRIGEGERARTVAQALQRRGLPPQFIYLAVQESNFRTDAIGPTTRYGIAKGMWQFIPATAERYGLRVGPDKDQRRFDPRDERFDFDKATNAAADYLAFLFTTEARASGLLVMSAYNWGEGNVERTLGRLATDPHDYNFWKLIQSQKIPDETYGYVLNIYAAAVIGEDPKLFGFDFENPLAGM